MKTAISYEYDKNKNNYLKTNYIQYISYKCNNNTFCNYKIQVLHIAEKNIDLHDILNLIKSLIE